MFSSEFLDDIVNDLSNQVYANKYVIKDELDRFNKLLKHKKYKDKNFNEIIILLFDDVLKEIDAFFSKYNFVPGINITAKINDINIEYCNGYTDYTKNKRLTTDTLFDIASISKTFTAILMYKAVNDNKININDNVKDILEEFNYLPDDLKIIDLLRYNTKFKTEGRIDDAKSKIEALKCIKGVVVDYGDNVGYNYNDITPILCGQILERIYNTNLITLTTNSIIEPLNLKNIEFNYSIKSNNITGSPNLDKKICNDPKANILMGYPGSAGIFSSTNDMVSVTENLIMGNLFKKNLSDFHTKNPIKLSRGLAGQSIVPTEIEKKGYFSNLSPIMSLGEDGSTRTIVMSGKYILEKTNNYVSSAIFTNPCSSDPDIIKYFERKNEKTPGTYYKYFCNFGAHRIDIREILPSSSLDNILYTLQIFKLRVTLIYTYFDLYEKKLDVNKSITIKALRR